MSGALSRGTPGRRAASMSEPHPGIRRDRLTFRRSAVVREWPPATGGWRTSWLDAPSVWSMNASSVRARRDDHRLDALVELAREQVVRVVDLFERKAMGDHVFRRDVS